MHSISFTKQWFSLVILRSRFETTRGLFWDGPRNFETQSDDKDDTCADTLPLNFRTTPANGRLTHGVRFNEHQAHMHVGYSDGSGFEYGSLQPQSRDLTTNKVVISNLG
ncbi:hypothetical protein AVEN_115647-1 [Araneus ventricosus]|uniref:Uncharacterized protein n=1 Tax=Araneus ventricosus TaxID=182803 RepID=A0A4Y2KZR5_ARAVE|nr:hypothetical protein AVEN_115647-1 [Araneus ventricosus]